MNNDLSSYFEDPEFKDLLAKYEGMVENHTPTYFDAEELTDIAEYYATQGEEQKAEEAIDFALRLHPNNTDALVFKSRSLCIKGKLSEAYQVMNLIEDPSDREVQFLKADLLMEEHRLEEAEFIYQELAQSEGESFDVLLDIALTYMDANQKDYAFLWIDKLRQKGYNETNNQKFRDAWCDYCMTFGCPEQATQAFQLSLDEQPYSIPHWNGLAKCYFAQNETEKACKKRPCGRVRRGGWGRHQPAARQRRRVRDLARAGQKCRGRKAAGKAAGALRNGGLRRYQCS